MRTVLVVAFVSLVVLCVVPVFLVVGDSFVSDSGGLTLGHYAAAFAPHYRIRILWHSTLLGLLSTAIALALGLPYALFTTRVRTPLRGLFSSLYVLPLVLPPLFMAMGWTQVLSGGGASPAGTGVERFLGGVWGAAILFGLAYFPFVTLFARKGFTEIGAGLEEAARVSTGPLRAFARITLPLAAPGVLAGALFVFLFSISDFSVVDYLSTVFPPKDRVSAYTFEAFSAWSTNWETQADRREAAALCTPFALISLVLLVMLLRLLRGGRAVSVTEGHARPRNLEEESPASVRLALRGTGLVFCTAVLGLSVGVPLVRTILDASARGGLVAGVRRALVPDDPNAVAALEDVGNSLFFAAVAGALMTVLALVLAHHAVRRGPGRERLVLALAFLPLAFGPILYGVGIIRTWNRPWLEIDGFNPVYGSWVVVVIMLVGKYLPFALAAVSSSLSRLDPAYEEAAAVSGAGGLRRILRVVAPLTVRGIAAGFVLGFVFALRELDTIVLIPSGNRTAIMKVYTWVHTAYETNVAALSLVLMALIGLPFLLYALLFARRVRVL